MRLPCLLTYVLRSIRIELNSFAVLLIVQPLT